MIIGVIESGGEGYNNQLIKFLDIITRIERYNNLYAYNMIPYKNYEYIIKKNEYLKNIEIMHDSIINILKRQQPIYRIILDFEHIMNLKYIIKSNFRIRKKKYNMHLECIKQTTHLPHELCIIINDYALY